MTATMPTAQVRGLVALMYPDHMTPHARRIILNACDAAEEQERAKALFLADALEDEKQGYPS